MHTAESKNVSLPITLGGGWWVAPFNIRWILLLTSFFPLGSLFVLFLSSRVSMLPGGTMDNNNCCPQTKRIVSGWVDQLGTVVAGWRSRRRRRHCPVRINGRRFVKTCRQQLYRSSLPMICFCVWRVDVYFPLPLYLSASPSVHIQLQKQVERLLEGTDLVVFEMHIDEIVRV